MAAPSPFGPCVDDRVDEGLRLPSQCRGDRHVQHLEHRAMERFAKRAVRASNQGRDEKAGHEEEGRGAEQEHGGKNRDRDRYPGACHEPRRDEELDHQSDRSRPAVESAKEARQLLLRREQPARELLELVVHERAGDRRGRDDERDRAQMRSLPDQREPFANRRRPRLSRIPDVVARLAAGHGGKEALDNQKSHEQHDQHRDQRGDREAAEQPGDRVPHDHRAGGSARPDEAVQALGATHREVLGRHDPEPRRQQ